MLEKDQIYTHYKGVDYKIICLAEHTDNQEKLVIYQSLKTGLIWARNRDVFQETFTFEGKEIKRFTLLKNA